MGPVRSPSAPTVLTSTPGPQSDDSVVVFSRNSSTGALTFVERKRDGVDSVDGLNAVHRVTISPDGSHVYAVPILDKAVTVFSRNSSTGALTFVEVIKRYRRWG